MREIKFRSWNGERMQHGGFSIHATGDVLADSLHGTHPITVMQYIGEKDDAGCEVYEGDILEYTDSYSEYRCVVKWNNEGDLGSCGCCYPEFRAVGFVGEIFGKAKNHNSHLSNSVGSGMKVIGNIYQNPELLNG